MVENRSSSMRITLDSTSDKENTMKSLSLPLVLAVAVSLCSALSAEVPESAFNDNPYPAEEGPVQVYILAGQSNMQGHASLRTLEYLIYNEETADEFEHLKDRMGRWVERRDVWVWTTDGERSGNLKPGFGASKWEVGPELGFGWNVGKKIDKQVLLIKTCWGGVAVKKGFLPPGSGGPGEKYSLMIEHVKNVLDNLKQHFPGYRKKQGYELAGLVWFQGWNDMVDREQRKKDYAGYTKRLGQLIRDVRKDLDAPELPAIIGELGVGGQGEKPEFRQAQKAVAKLPGLKDNVAFVETHPFWEPEVEKLVKEGVWQGPNWPEFYNVGSQKAYHYLGSGKMMYRIGKAFADSMLELSDE